MEVKLPQTRNVKRGAHLECFVIMWRNRLIIKKFIILAPDMHHNIKCRCRFWCSQTDAVMSGEFTRIFRCG